MSFPPLFTESIKAVISYLLIFIFFSNIIISYYSMKQIKNSIFRWSDDIRSRLFYSLAVMVSDKKIILETNPSYVVLYQIKKKN
jgi:predicted ATP-grasp superfamily ATP-dependent carboligase